MFRNPFHRDKPARSGTPPSETFEELARRYGSAGDFVGLGNALDQRGHAGLSAADEEAWFHLRGVAEWRQGHPEALDWFTEGLDLFPASGLLAFSLGQELEGRGDWATAERLFHQVQLGAGPEQQRLGLAQVPAQYVMTTVRYCYLWGAFDEAQRQLQTIIDVYGQLHIADDTFLYLRGLPFAGEVLSARCALAVLAGTPNIARDTISWASANLTDIELGTDSLLLEGWMEGAWEPLVSALRERAEATGPAADAFRGYVRTQLATVQSRVSGTLEEGRALLNGVRLSPEDFHWLTDMTTLATYGLATRFGDVSLRQEAQTTFLSRQKLLFEPHHAYEFGLLDSQEPLRALYQASKRSQ